MVDIVLNHTANNSKWIVDHPEATYNTDDCPHLWSAWLLDEAIMKFSENYANKKVPECPAAPYLGNENDLGKVMSLLRNKVVGPLKLHEFFLCEVQKFMRDEFIPGISNIDQVYADQCKEKFEREGWLQKPKFDIVNEHLLVGLGGKERMGVKLKMPDAAIFFMIVNQRNKQNAQKDAEKVLCQLNDHWMAKV